MSSSGAVDSSIDYSANDPTPHENEKLLSVSDSQGDAQKTTKYPQLSRKHLNYGHDRVTYEHMLVRYGSWSNVRVQVLAYTILLFVGFIYKAHVDFYEFTTTLHTIEQGRHIHCCCEKPARAEYLRELGKKFHSHGFYWYIKYLIPFVAGLSYPLWERYVSRHSVLLGSVIAGVPCSLLLLFSHTPDGLQVLHVLQNLCMTGTMLTSMITLTEILPYNLRALTVGVYIFVGGLATAITTLHFHLGFSLATLGILMSTGYFVSIFVVIFVAQDSILHMCIRNDADVVEKIIRKKEKRIFETNPEGDIYHHIRVARKIFEDLAYLDRDELKLRNFLKRIWRNSAMLEIVLALFQSLSAGMLDYELIRFYNERFAGTYLIGVERILGYPLVALMMFMLRRFHRVKAISLIMAGTLLIASVHHIIVGFGTHPPGNQTIFHVNFDITNGCAEFVIAEPRYDMFLAILNVVYFGFVSCNMILILVHFLETAPSSLRMSCLMMVYLPFQVASMMTPIFLNGRTYSTISLSAVYTYHLIIILITSLRARSKLPFSLYLFDLMPGTEREEGSERESSEEEGAPVPAKKASSTTLSEEERKKFNPLARMKKTLKNKR